MMSIRLPGSSVVPTCPCQLVDEGGRVIMTAQYVPVLVLARPGRTKHMLSGWYLVCVAGRIGWMHMNGLEPE